MRFGDILKYRESSTPDTQGETLANDEDTWSGEAGAALGRFFTGVEDPTGTALKSIGQLIKGRDERTEQALGELEKAIYEAAGRGDESPEHPTTLSRYNTGDALSDIGDYLLGRAHSAAREKAFRDNPEWKSKDLLDIITNPSDLGRYVTDPAGAWRDVPYGIGNALGFFVATRGIPESAAAGAAGRVLAPTSGLLGRLGANRAAKALGSDTAKNLLGSSMQFGATMGPYGALVNAGTIIDQLKEQGMSDAEIADAMGALFAEELPYDVAFAALTGNVVKGQLGRLAGRNSSMGRKIAANLLGVPLEMAGGNLSNIQQMILSEKYSGQPYGELFGEHTDAEKEAGRLGAIAGLPFSIGGVYSGVRDAQARDSRAQGWLRGAIADAERRAKMSPEDARQSYHDAVGLTNFINAISQQESGGDYSTVSGRTGATGRYQIIPETWTRWLNELGLPADTPMTPENQDRVAEQMMVKLYNEFGNWRDVAVAWYAGEDEVRHPRKDRDVRQGNGDEPSINEYADSVMAHFQEFGGEDTADVGSNGYYGENGAGEGKYWVRNDGVRLNGAQPGLYNSIDMISKYVYDATGTKIVVSSGTNGDHPSNGSEHGHDAGWKVDLVDAGANGVPLDANGVLFNSDFTPTEFCHKVIAYGRSLGLGMNLEDVGTSNVHLDVALDGTQWDGNGENAGGFNPRNRPASGRDVSRRADEAFNRRVRDAASPQQSQIKVEPVKTQTLEPPESTYSAFVDARLSKAVEDKDVDTIQFFSGMFGEDNQFIDTQENRDAIRERYGDEFTQFIEANTPATETTEQAGQTTQTTQGTKAKTQTQQGQTTQPAKNAKANSVLKNPAEIEAGQKFLEELRSSGKKEGADTALKLQAAIQQGDVATIKDILKANGREGLIQQAQQESQSQSQQTQQSTQVQENVVKNNTTPENVLTPPETQETAQPAKPKPTKLQQAANRASSKINPARNSKALESRKKIRDAMLFVASENGFSIPTELQEGLQKANTTALHRMQILLARAGLIPYEEGGNAPSPKTAKQNTQEPQTQEATPAQPQQSSLIERARAVVKEATEAAGQNWENIKQGYRERGEPLLRQKEAEELRQNEEARIKRQNEERERQERERDERVRERRARERAAQTAATNKENFEKARPMFQQAMYWLYDNGNEQAARELDDAISEGSLYKAHVIINKNGVPTSITNPTARSTETAPKAQTAESEFDSLVTRARQYQHMLMEDGDIKGAQEIDDAIQHRDEEKLRGLPTTREELAAYQENARQEKQHADELARALAEPSTDEASRKQQGEGILHMVASPWFKERYGKIGLPEPLVRALQAGKRKGIEVAQKLLQKHGAGEPADTELPSPRTQLEQDIASALHAPAHSEKGRKKQGEHILKLVKSSEFKEAYGNVEISPALERALKDGLAKGIELAQALIKNKVRQARRAQTETKPQVQKQDDTAQTKPTRLWEAPKAHWWDSETRETDGTEEDVGTEEVPDSTPVEEPDTEDELVDEPEEKPEPKAAEKKPEEDVASKETTEEAKPAEQKSEETKPKADEEPKQETETEKTEPASEAAPTRFTKSPDEDSAGAIEDGINAIMEAPVGAAIFARGEFQSEEGEAKYVVEKTETGRKHFVAYDKDGNRHLIRPVDKRTLDRVFGKADEIVIFPEGTELKQYKFKPPAEKPKVQRTTPQEFSEELAQLESEVESANFHPGTAIYAVTQFASKLKKLLAKPEFLGKYPNVMANIFDRIDNALIDSMAELNPYYKGGKNPNQEAISKNVHQFREQCERIFEDVHRVSDNEALLKEKDSTLARAPYVRDNMSAEDLFTGNEAATNKEVQKLAARLKRLLDDRLGLAERFPNGRERLFGQIDKVAARVGDNIGEFKAYCRELVEDANSGKLAANLAEDEPKGGRRKKPTTKTKPSPQATAQAKEYAEKLKTKILELVNMALKASTVNRHTPTLDDYPLFKADLFETIDQGVDIVAKTGRLKAFMAIGKSTLESIDQAVKESNKQRTPFEKWLDHKEEFLAKQRNKEATQEEAKPNETAKDAKAETEESKPAAKNNTQDAESGQTQKEEVTPPQGKKKKEAPTISEVPLFTKEEELKLGEHAQPFNALWGEWLSLHGEKASSVADGFSNQLRETLNTARSIVEWWQAGVLSQEEALKTFSDLLSDPENWVTTFGRDKATLYQYLAEGSSHLGLDFDLPSDVSIGDVLAGKMGNGHRLAIVDITVPKNQKVLNSLKKLTDFVASSQTVGVTVEETKSGYRVSFENKIDRFGGGGYTANEAKDSANIFVEGVKFAAKRSKKEAVKPKAGEKAEEATERVESYEERQAKERDRYFVIGEGMDATDNHMYTAGIKAEHIPAWGGYGSSTFANQSIARFIEKTCKDLGGKVLSLYQTKDTPIVYGFKTAKARDDFVLILLDEDAVAFEAEARRAKLNEEAQRKARKEQDEAEAANVLKEAKEKAYEIVGADKYPELKDWVDRQADAKIRDGKAGTPKAVKELADALIAAAKEFVQDEGAVVKTAAHELVNQWESRQTLKSSNPKSEKVRAKREALDDVLREMYADKTSPEQAYADIKAILRGKRKPTPKEAAAQYNESNGKRVKKGKWHTVGSAGSREALQKAIRRNFYNDNLVIEDDGTVHDPTTGKELGYTVRNHKGRWQLGEYETTSANSSEGGADTRIINLIEDDAKLTPRQKLLKDFAAKLGVPIQFFDNPDGRFHGAFSEGITFLNVNSKKGLGGVFWHESFHWLKANNPQLYAKLVDAAGITQAQRDTFLERTGRKDLTTNEAIDEEILADMMDDVAKRTGLMQSIAGKNRGLIERAVQWLKDTMNKFVETFRNPTGRLTTAQAQALAGEFGKIARQLKDADGNRIFRVNNRTGDIEVIGGRKTPNVSREQIEAAAQSPAAKYSVDPSDNSNQSWGRRIENLARSVIGLPRKQPERIHKKMKRLLSDLSDMKIAAGHLPAGMQAQIDEVAKVIRTGKEYDWVNVLPTVGNAVAAQLNITQSAEMGNCIGKFLYGESAPDTSAEFNEFTEAMRKNEELRDKILAVRDVFTQWHNMSVEEQMAASIQFEEEQEPLSVQTEKFFQGFKTQFVESLTPVQEAVEAFEKHTGMKLDDAINPMTAFRVYRGMAGRAERMIKGGERSIKALQQAMPNIDFAGMGFKTLRMILEPIGAFEDGAKQKAFSYFVTACHVMSIHKQNANNLKKQAEVRNKIAALKSELELAATKKDRAQIEKAIARQEETLDSLKRNIEEISEAFNTEEKCQKIIDKYDKQFRKAQQDLVTYSKALLAIRVDAGLMTRKRFDQLVNAYPDYVPLHRAIDEVSGGDTADSMERRAGSAKDIYDPIHAIMNNTFDTVKRAEKNKAKCLLATLARFDGVGRIFEEVEGSGNPKTTITFYENGKLKHLECSDESLVKAVNNLAPASMNWFIRALRVPTLILKGTATLWNPSFGIRNIFRDSQDAYVYSSKHGGNVIKDMIKYMTPWAACKGAFDAFKMSDIYEEFMVHGGAQSTFFTFDANYEQEVFDELAKGKYKRFASVKGFFKALETLGSYSEIGTRLGRFEQVKEDLKKKHGGVNIYGDFVSAALESRDLMDFARSGEAGRTMNALTAFANPAIQGWDKFFRTFDPHKLKLFGGTDETQKQWLLSVARLALDSFATALVLTLLHHDDDWYRDDVPDWEKETHWILSKNIRIPKPADVGARFISNVTEKALMWKLHDDPVTFKNIVAPLVSSLPDLLPTALQPIIECFTNYDMFRRSSIVPQREAKLPPEMQYDSQTSNLAKFIGEKIGVAPRYIDHMIYGYTSNFGRGTMRAVDTVAHGLGLSDRPPAFTRDWIPVIGGFLRVPYRNPKIVQDYYKALDEQESLLRGYKERRKTDKTAKLPEDYDRALHARLKGAQEQMRNLAAQERKVWADQSLSSEQVEERQRKIQERRIALCERIFRRAR